MFGLFTFMESRHAYIHSPYIKKSMKHNCMLLALFTTYKLAERNIKCSSFTMQQSGSERYFKTDHHMTSRPNSPCVLLNYLQQWSPKIQDSFVLWVALQVKGFIPIFSLLQQQDLKDNTLCK